VIIAAHFIISIKWKTERGKEYSHARYHKECEKCHLLPSSTTLPKLGGYTSIEVVSLRHYAVQGYSRSLLSVPVESPYASFYVWPHETRNIALLYSAKHISIS